jgi:hypothetical protein
MFSHAPLGQKSAIVAQQIWINRRCLNMPNNSNIAFTHSHEVLPDGAVAFRCSDDREKWPWLALPSSHPTVIQTINYWASVEAGRARGTYDSTKWSALTESHWVSNPDTAGPPSHGLADYIQDPDIPDRLLFRLTFFDKEGTFVCRLTGKGVIFQTRDFEGWRDKSKEDSAPPQAAQVFNFTSADELGVLSDVERFLSPLKEEDTLAATALVTKDNGLIPAHPYHSGSGDHVNANQLADTGFQFAHLIHQGRMITCTQGEIEFMRFVELGRPFTISLTAHDKKTGALSMEVHQGELKTTKMTLFVAEAG